jgi:hypothetical protein
MFKAVRETSCDAEPASRGTPRVRGLLAIALAGIIGLHTTSLAAAQVPEWDQVENIKDAATRLAVIQRTQGATKAFAFIDACYRTHSLSTDYTKAFEACIAQDYLETQVLALIYSRMSPETLQRMRAPSPAMLSDTMARRVGAAFAQYKITKEQIAEFKHNVDEQGFPVFFRALFPDAKLPMPNLQPNPAPPGAIPDAKTPEEKK